MCATGPDCISVDEDIDLARAKEISDRYNVTIAGNIPLTTVMLYGNQQDNVKCVVELLDGVPHKNLIVSSGCDMPCDVPIQNAVSCGRVSWAPADRVWRWGPPRSWDISRPRTSPGSADPSHDRQERQRPGSPLGAARSLPFRAVLVGEYRLKTVNVERLYGRTLSASPGSLSRERRRHSRYQLCGIGTGPAKDCLRQRQYVAIATLQVQTRPPPSPTPQEPAAGVRGAGTASPGRRSRESRGPSVRTIGTPDCW